MKERLRWLLWDVAAVLERAGNRLGGKPRLLDDVVRYGYEMNLYVECTESESLDIMDSITSILCQGHMDGKHHICVLETAVGMTRSKDYINE